MSLSGHFVNKLKSWEDQFLLLIHTQVLAQVLAQVRNLVLLVLVLLAYRLAVLVLVLAVLEAVQALVFRVRVQADIYLRRS